MIQFEKARKAGASDSDLDYFQAVALIDYDDFSGAVPRKSLLEAIKLIIRYKDTRNGTQKEKIEGALVRLAQKTRLRNFTDLEAGLRATVLKHMVYED